MGIDDKKATELFRQYGKRLYNTAFAHHIVTKRGGRNHAGDIDPIPYGRQET